MTEQTATELIKNLPNVLTPERIGNLTATILFHLTGQESGFWTITLKDSRCSVSEGKVENPNFSVTIDSQVYKNLIEGRLNPMAAFMQGKIRVSGDMNLAMRLQSLFRAG